MFVVAKLTLEYILVKKKKTYHVDVKSGTFPLLASYPKVIADAFYDNDQGKKIEEIY